MKHIKVIAPIAIGAFTEVAGIPMECIGHQWERTQQGSWVRLAVLA